MGFENPGWLLGVGLIAPLVWLYLHVRPRPPATVSSLRIWRNVPSPADPPRNRPKLPPLFWLQAALILVSSISLADPYRKEARPPGLPRDALLVIDVSASMQSDAGGPSRFESAIEAARMRANELTEQGRRITILRAGLQPEVLATGLDALGARETLSRLEPLDTTANLTASIELAATLAGVEGSIDAFSDTKADEIVMSRDARGATTLHIFDQGEVNVAVTDVRIQTHPFEQDAPSRILVTVRNFSTEPQEVGLAIVPLEAQPEATANAETKGAVGEAPGSSADVAGPEMVAEENTPPLERTLKLRPREQKIVGLDSIRFSGIFEARLSADDDLPLDDIVYGHVPRGRSIDLLLVSDDAAFAQRIEWLAKRAGSFTVRTVAPANYHPQDSGEITLFDRYVPKLPPPSNAAYLAPASGNADVTVVPRAGEVKVAERRDHPLLRGVTSSSTLLGDTPVGLAPGALRPVLVGRSKGRELALVQAGEIGGRQIVTTAFRVDPDALTRADDLPSLIFVLNLLSFLTPEAAGAPILRTAGERLRAGSRVAAPIEKLEGPSGEHALTPGSDLTLERAGVYDAMSRTGTRPVFVSFVDATESDIRRDAAGGSTPPSAKPPAAAVATGKAIDSAWNRVPYLHELLMLVALLLVAEWAIVAITAPRLHRHAGSGG